MIDELLAEIASNGWSLGHLTLFDGAYHCNLVTDDEVTIMATAPTIFDAITAAMSAEWMPKPSAQPDRSLAADVAAFKPKFKIKPSIGRRP